MYECIQVQESREDDSVLEAEGPLDNETDCSDVDEEKNIKSHRNSAGSRSITSTTGAEAGSPMMLEF
jgi:hypothetical protein